MAWRHGKGIYPGRELYWRKGVDLQEDQQLAGIREPEVEVPSQEKGRLHTSAPQGSLCQRMTACETGLDLILY